MSEHSAEPERRGDWGQPPAAIDPSSALAMVRVGAAVLLDVREQDEWDAGHAPGALHVPLGQLDAAAFAPATGWAAGATQLIAVCRSGRRSATAVNRLAEACVTALNLDGGMQAWQRAGLPIIRDDQSPGTVA